MSVMINTAGIKQYKARDLCVSRDYDSDHYLPSTSSHK
jgi:hypothetical protein